MSTILWEEMQSDFSPCPHVCVNVFLAVWTHARVSEYIYGVRVYLSHGKCLYIYYNISWSQIFLWRNCIVLESPTRKEFYLIGIISNVDGAKSRLCVRRRSCVQSLSVNYNISAHCKKPCVILNVWAWTSVAICVVERWIRVAWAIIAAQLGRNAKKFRANFIIDCIRARV